MGIHVNASAIKGASSAATAYTVTIPAGTGIQAGDLIIAVCVGNGTHVANGVKVTDSVNGSGTPYSALFETDQTNASSFWQDSKWFITPVAIADGSTFTFTPFASSTVNTISIEVFRGYQVIDQPAVGPTNSSASASVVSPALGGNAAPNALVVSLVSGEGATTLTQPGSTYTTGTSVQTATRCCGIAYVLAASGASTYGVTWTQGTSGSWAGQSVSFTSPQPVAVLSRGRRGLRYRYNLQFRPAAAPQVAGPVDFPSAATLAGTGALTTQPVVNFVSAASLSGTGSLTAQPVVNFAGAASLSGTGALTSQPVVGFAGAASLSGTGSLTSQPVVGFLEAASLSGTGTLTSTAAAGFSPAAALSGSGSLTTAAVVNFASAASLSGTGSLTAQPVVNFLPAAALSGSGLLTSQPVVNFISAASLSGTGALTAQPVVNFLVAAALAGTGVLAATAATSGNVTAAAALSGTGSLTAAALVNFASAAALAGTGQLTSAVVVNYVPAAVLAGTGTLTSAALVSYAAAALLSGTGKLTAAAVVSGAPGVTFIVVMAAPGTEWETGALTAPWTASFPVTAWEIGPDIATAWEAGAPETGWEPGDLADGWEAGTVTADWQDG